MEADEVGLTSIRSTCSDAGVHKLEIVNQLVLPHTTEWIPVESIDDAWRVIRTMQIRGAPAIASLASLAVALHLTRLLDTKEEVSLSSPQTLADHVKPLLDHLYTARPTAVNLGAAMKRLSAVLTTKSEQLSDANSATQAARALAQALINEARAVDEEDVGRNREMSRRGAEWLIQDASAKGRDTQSLNVLTVCNTGSLATSGYGTALGLITHLHATGHLARAYFTQSAPYHQGSRLTSLELKTLRIPSTMICDTMVGSLFQNRQIDAVAVGADRVARNGDTANKVGTYNAAVLAARHGIPFLVVAPVSTVDLDTPDGAHTPIEQRPPLEACVVRGALHPPRFTNASDAGASPAHKEQASVMITPELDGEDAVYNPSFDVTPADLITAIVTEKGVVTREPGQDVFDLSVIV